MPTEPTPSPSPSPSLDPALQAALSGLNSPTMSSTEALLQEALFGLSGRQGITGTPLTGIMPGWASSNPELARLVNQGQVDPYLPSNDPSTWRVYMGAGEKVAGTKEERADRGRRVLDTETPGGDTTATVGQVMNQPFTWTEDQVADAIKKFQAAGLKDVNDFDSMQKAWSGLVQRAGAMYSMSSGKRKVTPWDVLELYKSEASKAGVGLGGYSGTKTQVQKTVSEISEGDAWSVMRQTLSSMLGRDPEDQEVRDFTYKMNGLAAKNPSISTTVGTYENGDLLSSSTTTKAGFNSSDIAHNAYDQAQEDPDYAEFQSASTYFNAAVNALGEIGA